MKPLLGIFDMSIEDYHKAPGLSRSDIVKLRKSPAHFDAITFEEDKKSEAFEFGSLVHTLILEPEKFEKKYHVYGQIKRTTKIGKQAFENEKKISGGRILITEQLCRKATNIVRSLNQDRYFVEMTSGGLNEKSLFWQDEETEVICKSRPDIIQSEFILDIKTTLSASSKAVRNDVFKYGYDIQAAMALDGLNALGNKIDDNKFCLISIEKTFPHHFAIDFLSPDVIAEARAKYKEQLNVYKECKKTGHWPGYGIRTITLGGSL